MIPFLKQVAGHYCGSSIKDKCFVFPSRRAMLFFSKYLAESVGGTPLIAPEMMTINDLFYRMTGAVKTDRLSLLLELYDCYSSVNKEAEPLDDFIFWGDVILADFNDADKYLADPEQLFTNISDLRSIQDDYTFLSDIQRTAIENFIGHFIGGKAKSSDVKNSFLRIWNILLPLYHKFNEVLSEKGLSYEGMVYRALAGMVANRSVLDIVKESFEDTGLFVFVGLNALNECEKTVLRGMKAAGVAEFCWDYSGCFISNPINRSSYFMSSNIADFPQAFPLEDDGKVPSVNVISVPSAVGQAKQLPGILAGLPGFKPDETAVILPDETLLSSLLNSVPPEIEDINVTMGYPMTGSMLHSLMSDIMAMQLHAVEKNGEWVFYHRQIWNILSNGLFRKIFNDWTGMLMAGIRSRAQYYIPSCELCICDDFSRIFRPVISDQKSCDANQIGNIISYQKEVISILAVLMDGDGLAMELEFAREYYRILNLLSAKKLPVTPLSYAKLLNQMLAGVTVPFKGEPLRGLQIMGPLETRCLDFRNLIIMSANESVFPKRSVSSSFIPPELRRGFSLPTYEYQDAVWAYYFYRMISRAENVWLVCDSRTEGLHTGEESRYIKQLQYHFGVGINRYVASSRKMSAGADEPVGKTDGDVAKIRQMSLSATALQTYLSCPASFFYKYVKGLEPEKEVAESLDNGMFGTIYHALLHEIYSDSSAAGAGGNVFVGKEYLSSWLSDKGRIKRRVNELIMETLGVMEISGRNLVVSDVIVRYVARTLERDIEILKGKGRNGFDIIGLEMPLYGDFEGQKFKGFIDRMDSCGEGMVRIVDYKTGKVLDEDENICDSNAEMIAELVFKPEIRNRPKIALQFFIYDMLYHMNMASEGMSLYNTVYSTSCIFRKTPAEIPENRIFRDAMEERLRALLSEMYDVSIPFRRTEMKDICKYCNFKVICGR